MKTSGLAVIALCSIIAMHTGCSSNRTSGSKDWIITVGSGGGVTGGSSGYSIEHSGKVQSWRIMQASSEKETTTLFTMDCDSAAFYRTYLDLIHFDTISFTKTGNWTSFVEFKEGEVAHRVSWTGDAGPRLVESFYELFVGYINSRIKH